MLCLSGELAEILEPFNPRSVERQWIGTAGWYPYIDAHNGDAYAERVRRMLELRFPLTDRLVHARSARTVRDALSIARWSAQMRRQGRRVLVKDPIAMFSTQWLVATFGFTPVVIVRHPAAFVSSVRRVDWKVRFGSWLRQPELMRTLLAPWADAVVAADAHPRGDVYDAALFWAAMTGVIAHYRSAHPDWIVVRHEDLSTDPHQQFASLYDRLGLTMTDSVLAGLDAATAATNPTDAGTQVHVLERDSRSLVSAWHDRLRPDEIAEVRAVTADVSALFYEPSSWESEG
jgi:hypothetical protein